MHDSKSGGALGLLAAISLLLCVCAVAPVGAECIAHWTERAQNRRIVRLLEGTVRDRRTVSPNWSVVRIDVHRVWKGPVTKAAIFYFVPELDAGPDMAIGDRLVFFGVRPKAHDLDRTMPGGGDPQSKLVLECWGGEAVTPELIARLGRARTPE